MFWEPGQKGPHKFQNHLLGTSPLLGNLWCQLGLDSKRGTIACGKGRSRIWATEGLGLTFSASLWTCVSRPTLTHLQSHQPLLTTLELLVPCTECEQGGLQPLSLGLEAEPSPFQMGSGQTVRAPWVRPWERVVWDSACLKCPSILPSPHGRTFPEYSSLPSTVWFCLKHCPECISKPDLFPMFIQVSVSFIDCSAQ